MDLLLRKLQLFWPYSPIKMVQFACIGKIDALCRQCGSSGLIDYFPARIALALSKLSLKSKKYGEVTEFDKFLESISQSVFRLTDRKIGAFVVLENQDSLEDIANKAVIVMPSFPPNY